MNWNPPALQQTLKILHLHNVSAGDNFVYVVLGLPQSGSWQDLKDHMREAGDVCYADVFRDGTGVVEFVRKEDMTYAVRKLDNTKFRSHEVCVLIWLSWIMFSLLCQGEYFRKRCMFEAHLALIAIYGLSTIGRNVVFSMSSSLVSARERLLTFAWN